ncbi:hypothetical protein ANO11243_068020 [Dothideomycetidae sp. 11243]|nr:hypothetical protein ANO11243_068020 [fungal sp. No.11243]
MGPRRSRQRIRTTKESPPLSPDVTTSQWFDQAVQARTNETESVKDLVCLPGCGRRRSVRMLRRDRGFDLVLLAYRATTLRLTGMGSEPIQRSKNINHRQKLRILQSLGPAASFGHPDEDEATVWSCAVGHSPQLPIQLQTQSCTAHDRARTRSVVVLSLHQRAYVTGAVEGFRISRRRRNSVRYHALSGRPH